MALLSMVGSPAEVICRQVLLIKGSLTMVGWSANPSKGVHPMDSNENLLPDIMLFEAIFPIEGIGGG